MMTFLRVAQSEEVMKHVFATLRSFMHKFPSVLFQGSANVCGVLCYEVSSCWLELKCFTEFCYTLLYKNNAKKLTQEKINAIKN